MSRGAEPIRFHAPGQATTEPGLAFEHLVQINDPQDPRIAPLTQAQVWRGLLLRMEFPQNFQPGIDSCHITRLDDGEWLRVIDYGSALVRDRVQFVPPRHITVEVLGAQLSARLEMIVEAPPDGSLWLRFRYRTQSPEHQDGAPLSALIKDAWRQADEETVFRIRQLAATGALDD